MFGKKKKVDKTNKTKLKGFIKVTRLYASGNSVKAQPVIIAKAAVDSFRPRNKIDGQHCTIVTRTGVFVNVKERFSVVERLLIQA